MGVTLLLLGGSLVAFVAVASADGPSITVAPHSRLVSGENFVIRGRGFTKGSNGAILQCNNAPGQPATVIQIHGLTHSIPVGCTSPVAATTTNLGRLVSKPLVVQTGTLGGWETGIDSAGGQAAADSAGYPCPPTSAQLAVGVACVVEFIDNKGQVALHSVTFKAPRGSTTTTTTTSTTTSTTTTTTQPCIGVALTAAGVNTTVDPTTRPSLTANPGTCLVGGSVVDLSGFGFQDSSPGTVLECNSDPNQPTVSYPAGDDIPVSCTDPFTAPGVVVTSASGDAGPVNFRVVEGTTGPPCAPSSCTGVAATDSAGGNPFTDAAAYPCPPTAAQIAAGDTCGILYGDSNGDAVTVPIAFNPSVAPPS